MILRQTSQRTSEELLTADGKEKLAGEILKESSRILGFEVEDEEEAPKAKKKKKARNPFDDEEDEKWLESIQQVQWNGQKYDLSLGGYQVLILERKLHAGEFSAGSKNESLACESSIQTSKAPAVSTAFVSRIPNAS